MRHSCRMRIIRSLGTLPGTTGKVRAPRQCSGCSSLYSRQEMRLACAGMGYASDTDPAFVFLGDVDRGANIGDVKSVPQCNGELMRPAQRNRCAQ